MSVLELVKQRRSIRRFQQQKIEFELLSKIVDAGRLAPSARNLQPIEFIVIDDIDKVANIFLFTRWAGYLPPDEGKPPSGKEPVSFIIVLINRSIKEEGGGEDVGAAVENMILAALEHGIGTCWIGSIDRVKTSEILGVPDHYEVVAALALGYPDETPVIETIIDSVKYYKDDEGHLHVPKRSLDMILHRNTFKN